VTTQNPPDLPDTYREHLEREKTHARDRVIQNARSVIRRAERLAQYAEGQDDPSINPLGELQSSGTMLDAACATYAACRQALKDYDMFQAMRADR
jgi:hypothetical protein